MFQRESCLDAARPSRHAIFQRFADVLVVAVDGVHAPRVVDDHDHERQAGPLQEQLDLGDHQQHQPEDEQAHGGQGQAIAAAGLAAFTKIDAHDDRDQHRRRPARWPRAARASDSPAARQCPCPARWKGRTSVPSMLAAYRSSCVISESPGEKGFQRARAPRPRRANRRATARPARPATAAARPPPCQAVS